MTTSETLKLILKLCTGGTSCGVVLENHNAIVLAVDKKQIYHKIVINRNSKGRNVETSIHYEHDPQSKITVFGEKFALTGVGWRQYVEHWLLHLQSDYIKNKDEYSVETCREILEAYRLNNLADKDNLETVEILLAGWDKDNKPKLYYFHNGGCTQITSAHCTGKGANTAWMALVNKGFKTWKVTDAMEAAKCAIYDAYLRDNGTGVGVDVLVLYPNKCVKYPHQKMDELKMHFGPITTYMEALNGGVGTRNTKKLDDHGNLIGTTTVGFVVEKGHCIILGSDSEIGNASGRIKYLTKKVFRLGEKTNFQLSQGITRAGVEKEVDFMRAQLDTYVQENQDSSDITRMPDYVLRKVLESKMSANHRGHLLIGGYNKGCHVPHLYYVNSAGVLDLTAVSDIVELKNRFQTGSGGGAAFVVSNNKYDSSMSEEAGISLVLESIYNAVKNDKYTGQGLEYLVIRSSGEVVKKEMTIPEYEKQRRQSRLSDQ